MSVTEVLDKALGGERISDAEALTLLESRDLVSVGRGSTGASRRNGGVT